MRILFLTHYFPPEVNAPASRTFEHCREWVSKGHEVHVITCVPNHPAGRIYPGYRNRLLRHEEVAGIQVHRVLTESARVGRTEGFAEVAFGADQPEGTILEVRIAGQDGARLLA